MTELDSNRPIVIAHRGASGYVPEHTLMAKGIAHAMEADYLEQDVVASKDGVPIVLHDIQIDTVTDVAKKFPDSSRGDGRFYAIDFTLEQLRSLRVFERFDHRTGKAVFPDRYPTGEGDFRIVTLKEEIQFIQNLNRSTGREAGIYPEIKRPAWHREQAVDLSRATLDVIAAAGYTEKEHRCFVQCFDADEVRRIRHEWGYRGRLIQLLAEGRDEESGTDYEYWKTRAGLTELAKVADGIGPSLGDIVDWSEELTLQVGQLTAMAHQAKLLVHPWTCRSDALPERCPSSAALLSACFESAGIDGIFADQPDIAVRYLRSAGC